jgi:hypothetical protein
MQERRDFRDHLEAEDDREDEDRELENEQQPVTLGVEPAAPVADPIMPDKARSPPPWVG